MTWRVMRERAGIGGRAWWEGGGSEASAEYLRDRGLLVGQGFTALADCSGEVPTSAELEDHDEVFRCVLVMDQADDVDVVEGLHGLDFVAKLLLVLLDEAWLLALELLPAHLFYCNNFAGLYIHPLVHGRERPGTERLSLGLLKFPLRSEGVATA